MFTNKCFFKTNMKMCQHKKISHVYTQSEHYIKSKPESTMRNNFSQESISHLCFQHRLQKPKVNNITVIQ